MKALEERAGKRMDEPPSDEQPNQAGTIQAAYWTDPGRRADSWVDRSLLERCITVKNPDGTVSKWMIEGGTPNTLFRRGFTKDSLKEGTELTVEGFRAKNGPLALSSWVLYTALTLIRSALFNNGKFSCIHSRS